MPIEGSTGTEAFAASTAPSALTMPAPQFAVEQFDPAGNGFAVCSSSERTAVAVASGATESSSETTPATIGAAKLVPPTAL